MALHDLRYAQPPVRATILPTTVSPIVLRALYRARWPIEQLPLVAKQMIGALLHPRR